MKTTRSFFPANRYHFDFGQCSSKNGFAQVDTGQDASYFGTWANPETLTVVCYLEGDIVIKEAETTEEFVAELRKTKDWNEEMGYGFQGIDPGWNHDNPIATKFKALGLGDLLH